MCVAKHTDLEKWSHVTVDEACLRQLLPGPVTLVFDRKDTLPKELNPNTTSIGIRIPDYKFMIELAAFCDEPIALTSANVSNQPSSLSIKEFESLWDHLDLIVDGGELSQNQLAKAGSTVIDLTKKGTYKIIREGR
jgi:tRNA threonylcarbamoyl adenosine modification protein (Sua5/YciO/YrdC/YwlC family)